MSQESHRVRRGLRVYSLRTHDFFMPPRENEIRVLERDGRRWLQQWRMPPGGERHQRTWVEVAELPWPSAHARRIAEERYRDIDKAQARDGSSRTTRVSVRA